MRDERVTVTSASHRPPSCVGRGRSRRTPMCLGWGTNGAMRVGVAVGWGHGPPTGMHCLGVRHVGTNVSPSAHP